MIHFTSDTHFGHTNIIKYCKRPFANADKMDDALIKAWNACVGPKDEVYHLGDFAFGSVEFWWARRRALNGRIYLVRGNHDLKQMPFGMFEWVKDYHELKVADEKRTQEIVLFHYGLRTWHHDLRGTWHLYGHSHDQLEPLGKSVDVGVDTQKFRPISYEELKKWMDAREVHKAPMWENYFPVKG